MMKGIDKRSSTSAVIKERRERVGHRAGRSLSWVGAMTVAMACAGLVVASDVMAADPSSSDGGTVQQVEGAVSLEKEQVIEEYDPWEPYNEKMFSFNHDVVDQYVLKPVGTVWDYLPDPVQESLGNAFDNVAMPRRVVNNLLQAKFKGAGTELTRFGINTTVGVVGLFDVAKKWGFEKQDADTGQTLGKWGVGPGPYFVLPFLPPLTVRDAFGLVADVAMDPINYFVPLAASFGRRGGETVNTRSQNLELYESVEESTVDLYSAVRNAYLQRRQNAIEQ
ncbi:MAG: ABC transporter [Candidatus Methylomirabilota bacterium]|nr:VacJ family lipoprotein [candidate division NC10 bacterium]PWB45842.1 MAG: ABC transporter [candidate division NC10 bacterium]